jgi:uncharacterized repeat protein (TIGR01451 family)
VRYRNSVKRLLSVAVILTGGIASVGLTAPTSAAAATGPDLQVSIVVTPSKATYAVGDAITTTFVVTNNGTAAATSVHLDGGMEEGVTRASDPPADQFDLAPGESHSVAWAGTIGQGGAILGYAFGVWSFADKSQAYWTGAYRIMVPGMTGTLNGKVFIDFKGNYDSTQAGLGRVTVAVTNNDSGQFTASTMTDSAGRFTLPNLPAGDYQLRVINWKIEGADSGNFTMDQVMGGEAVGAYIPIVPGSQTPPHPRCIPCLAS